MTAILDNLISLITLSMGSLFGNLVLLAITPIGFILLSLLLISAEYLIIKSINKNPNGITFKKVINYIKYYQLRYSPLSYAQGKVFDIILNKESISIKEISENVGMTINSTRKLVNDLIDRRHIMRKINVNNRRKSCYMSSTKETTTVKEWLLGNVQGSKQC